jgi:hypothetical protein
MSEEDLQYYRGRALVERSRVASAPTPETAFVHDQLAGLYEALICQAPAEGAAAPTLWPPAHKPPPAQG